MRSKIPVSISLVLVFLTVACLAPTVVFAEEEEETIKVAGVTTVMRDNSHSEVQLARLFKGFNLDGTGDQLEQLELVSLYVDQFPENDLSRKYAEYYDFELYEPEVEGEGFEAIKQALTLGTGELAVDAIYLCPEHGDYPKSETGNTMYPKRRFFEAVVEVFEESGEVVPVFMDKHVADNWEDAKWIYDTAQEMGIPMQAGSSVQLARRHPPVKPSGKIVQEGVGAFYGSIDGHTFHTLELVQSFVEQRPGGETGVERVKALQGEEAWEAIDEGLVNKELLAAAISRSRARSDHWTKEDLDTLKEYDSDPVVYVIDYNDGLRVSLFGLPGVFSDYTFAWRTNDPKDPVQSVLSNLQGARPFTHHGNLMEAFQEMAVTGEPVYPVERTLLVSGIVDEGLRSLNLKDGEWVETPFLDVSYETDWEWEQPTRYPPDRTPPWTLQYHFPGDEVETR